MAKESYVFPEEYKRRAVENGLNLATVYKRLERDWDLERAVTTPPGKVPTHFKTNRRVKGAIQAGERPRGKSRAFSFYKDLDDKLDKAIAESGVSQSSFIAIAVEFYLNSKEGKNDEKGKRGRGQSNSSSRNSRAKKKTT